MKFCSVCNRNWEDDFKICPIDGVPLEEKAGDADPHVGQTMANCRIVEKIADGELGPIYKAEDPVRGVVAIQIIPQEQLGSPVLIEAFGDAVNQAAKINHPNVVRTYGMETGPGGSTLVFMDFLEGTTFEQYRKDHPGMSPPEVCALIRQAAEGVMAAHRTSVLHGALHPSRVLIDRTGGVRVAGFHRSGMREGVDAMTATPENLPYLSPEQVGIVRDLPALDYRTDVYTLGVILYESLSGHLPYDAKSVPELAAIMEGAPPLPPNFTNPQVSPLLSRTVQRAIAKHPSERHGSIEEFIRELDASSQPSREPQQPVGDQYAPPYPSPSPEPSPVPHSPRPESDLFAAPAAIPPRGTGDGIWSEPQDDGGGGEGSIFGWFKTRVGSSRRSRKRSEPDRLFRDDSTFGGGTYSRTDDDSDEHTVVVSGRSRSRRSRKRGFLDTFTNYGNRDQDMTGTGVLPRRRLSSKVYMGLGIGAILLLSTIFALLYFTSSPPMGKLMVNSSPHGAQVYIDSEYRGATPLPYTELPPGVYTLRVEAEGFETKVDRVEIAQNADIQREYVLVRQAALEVPLLDSEPPPDTPDTPAASPSPRPVKLPPFESMLNASLRSRNFFPPTPDNAWDILKRWQRALDGETPPSLLQARGSFCREIEVLGREKLDQKDFAGTRALLDKLREHDPAPECIGGLQSVFEEAVSQSLEELRISARAAMDRENYVTPEIDNALRYVRLMLAVDPRESEATTLESEIFTRSWDQAIAKSDARQHQDALDIYRQLRQKYREPPVDMATIEQNIQRQTTKVGLLKQMRVPYSVQVRHRRGRRFLIFGSRDDAGVLRIDGFGIEFRSSGENSFKVTYDGLNSVQVDKNKLVIKGVGVPEGEIELEPADDETNLDLTGVRTKIEEYRRLYKEYVNS